MTIRLDEQGTIRLEGECSIEEADRLLQLLLAHPAAAVDWRGCRSAHTAVIQLLLAAHRPVNGPPEDAFLALHVQPALATVQNPGG